MSTKIVRTLKHSEFLWVSFDVCLFCRNGFLQLDESMVAMNQDMGQGGIILASDGDYLTQKDGTIPQFAALNIVEGQVGQVVPDTPYLYNKFSRLSNFLLFIFFLKLALFNTFVATDGVDSHRSWH